MKNKYLLAAVMVASCGFSLAQEPASKEVDIHLIWMGGNDCSNCVEWDRKELPKLKESPEFKRIKFTHVEKGVKSSVPSSFFLPSEVVPYKEKLDKANPGLAGSPHIVFMVNGEVYDYFWRARPASEIEAMLIAIRNKKDYPQIRCQQYDNNWQCVKKNYDHVARNDVSEFLAASYGLVFQPEDKARWLCPKPLPDKPKPNWNRSLVCQRSAPPAYQNISWRENDETIKVIEADHLKAYDPKLENLRCKESPFPVQEGKLTGTLRDCTITLPDGERHASFFHIKQRDSYLTFTARNPKSGPYPPVADTLRQWLGEIKFLD